MNPVYHDSDDWRRVQQRLDELEDRLGETSSKVTNLMDRQQIQHSENKRDLEDQKRSLEGIRKMLIGERGDNGLVGTVTLMNAKLDSLDKTFANLPKTVLTILLIFTALIGLLSFFGPSLRKAVGLPAAHVIPAQGAIFHRPAAMDSSIPTTVSTR